MGEDTVPPYSGQDVSGKRSFNPTMPSTARVYAYLGGGKDALPPERAAGDSLLEGCDLEEPGLVEVSKWRPKLGPPPEDVGNALILGCLADLNAYGSPEESRPEVA
ncbi:hypothetical protein DP939_44275 [Spongiactinospora rosea]|uniref:Uncharacterized protein n=1 Tax=Spongiactinospora rosea TaxID=2248750 RepID=A0A366LE54_9ACTN|nr:hypothetical protein [Spongiactinospora rosea]RBQ12165.1 hypothetical protein DP939_44275 [Spongiactinospora rosea]